MDLRSLHVCNQMHAPSLDVFCVPSNSKHTVDFEAGGRGRLPVRLGSRILATVFPVLQSAPGSHQALCQVLDRVNE